MIDHTFVIPAYKNSPHLEACIVALKNQTLPTNILIATSTPSSYIETIAAKHQVPYFVSKEPSSIGGDWNFAVSKARTRYITIAHQDDIYDPAYTTQILTALTESQKSVPLIAFSGYRDIVNGIERKTSLNARLKSLMLWPFRLKRTISAGFVKKMVLAFGNSICCPSVTFDLAHIKELQFSMEYTCVLDWAAWLQMAESKGAFVYVPGKLVQHRIHIDSETTNQIQNGRRRAEELDILTRIWGKPLAKLIAKLYTRGYADNKV